MEKSLVEQISSRQRSLRRLTRRTIRDLIPRTVQEDGPQNWRECAQTILNDADPEFLTHHLMRRIERQDLKVMKGLSFHHFMVQQSEERRIGLPSSAWELDEKLKAYRFIDAVNFRRPHNDLQQYRFSSLPKFAPSVIKPAQGTGARGCYLVFSDTEMVHISGGEKFTSWPDLEDHAKQLMDKSLRAPIRNRWFIEELVLEDSKSNTPARDLKYFTFYGEVALVLEVIRSEGSAKYSFMLPDNTPVLPGTWDYNYFEGTGTTPEHLESIRALSLQIPHPFLRIDMLKGEGGLVFGEFTPRPGQFHRFTPEWDRIFGEHWARAQHRLQNDLLMGKSFKTFRDATDYLKNNSVRNPV